MEGHHELQDCAKTRDRQRSLLKQVRLGVAMPQLAAQAAPSVFDVNLGGPAAAAAPEGDSNGGAAAPAQSAAAPASAAAAAPADKPEAAPAEAPGVVSKWTLVDYDEEGAALCASGFCRHASCCAWFPHEQVLW